MTKKEFDDTLKRLSLSRQEFCKITGLAYSTVSNWNDEKLPLPSWVDSWLVNYERSSSYEEIKRQILKIECPKNSIILSMADSNEHIIVEKKEPKVGDKVVVMNDAQMSVKEYPAKGEIIGVVVQTLKK